MTDEAPLSANLREYVEAYQQEYELAKTGTSDELAIAAKTRLAALLPEASLQLQRILRNGDKDDAVPLQAIKLVFEYTLGKPANKTEQTSDVDKIIASLMENSSNAERSKV